jgi:DNA polymerase I-like protein with 3'-5' exonuclease and polymerase domains
MADEFKSFNLPIGDDGRVRAGNLPFSQKTMRSSPQGGSIFAMDARNRWLIHPQPFRCLAYIDLSSCEFVVAAAVSGDKNMLKICDEVRNDPTKNVYVEIMKAAAIARADDTKKTVGPAYKDWKIGGLATLYGQEAEGLAKNLNVAYRTARFINQFFHEHFPTYWRFINNQVVRGQSRGFMETLGGWRLDTRHQKLTTLKNFPIQANACEILHLGAVKMVDSGLAICTTVHDAVLIEAIPSEIEEHVRIAQECFRDAGLEILGYPMSSDSYIFSNRFEDEDGAEGWKRMLELLEEEN